MKKDGEMFEFKSGTMTVSGTVEDICEFYWTLVKTDNFFEDGPIKNILEEIEQEFDLFDQDEEGDCDYSDPLDGDAVSALASVGWGTDEDYGYFEFD